MNDIELIPDGDYAVQIEFTELRAAKAKPVVYQNIRFRIISGVHKNRVIFDNFVVGGQQEFVVSYGIDSIKKIYKLVNSIYPKKFHDVSILIGKTLKVSIASKELPSLSDDAYRSFMNCIVEYKTFSALDDMLDSAAQKRQRLIFIIAEKMYNSSRCLKGSMNSFWTVLDLSTTVKLMERICNKLSGAELEYQAIQMMELT